MGREALPRVWSRPCIACSVKRLIEHVDTIEGWGNSRGLFQAVFFLRYPYHTSTITHHALGYVRGFLSVEGGPGPQIREDRRQEEKMTDTDGGRKSKQETRKSKPRDPPSCHHVRVAFISLLLHILSVSAQISQNMPPQSDHTDRPTSPFFIPPRAPSSTPPAPGKAPHQSLIEFSCFVWV